MKGRDVAEKEHYAAEKEHNTVEEKRNIHSRGERMYGRKKDEKISRMNGE